MMSIDSNRLYNYFCDAIRERAQKIVAFIQDVSENEVDGHYVLCWQYFELVSILVEDPIRVVFYDSTPLGTNKLLTADTVTIY